MNLAESMRNIDIAALRLEASGALVANPPTPSQKVFDLCGYSIEALELATKLARTKKDEFDIRFAATQWAAIEADRLRLKATLMQRDGPSSKLAGADSIETSSAHSKNSHG